jgi:hypothetical protein
MMIMMMMTLLLLLLLLLLSKMSLDTGRLAHELSCIAPQLS